MNIDHLQSPAGSVVATVEHQASSLLEQAPHFRRLHRRVNIQVQQNKLHLTGVLPTYFLKQLAQEILRPLGWWIQNRIEVVDEPVSWQPQPVYADLARR